jgi:hypothetical protein
VLGGAEVHEKSEARAADIAAAIADRAIQRVQRIVRIPPEAETRNRGTTGADS